ncbi:sterol desaturase family protein [Myxococcota bacterium]|nr:sterol desaturase family protein [Myxococcota bacterium]
MIDKLAAWLFFPVVLAVSIVAGNNLIEAGKLTVPVMAGSALVIFAGERLFPNLPSWNRSHGDVLVDLCHVVTVSLTNLLMVTIIPMLLAPAAAWTASLGTARLWPSDASLLLQLPLAMVVAEFFQYWSHRLSHTWEPFWRLHATHHSAPRLYFFNAGRFHPLDIAIDSTAGLVPLTLLGTPHKVMLLFALTTAVLGYLQHSNVRFNLGPLNYVFSMAELHRWHHAKNLDEANKNYGSNLILWDLIFGTFFWPRDRKPPETIGIPDLPAFPETYWGQILSPFRWKKIQAESRVAA